MNAAKKTTKSRAQILERARAILAKKREAAAKENKAINQSNQTQEQVMMNQDQLFEAMANSITSKVLKNLMPAIDSLQQKTETVLKMVEGDEVVTSSPSTTAQPEVKRGPGRPKGSKSTRRASPQISPFLFRKAFANASSVGDVIGMFPELKQLEPEHAHQYVISHAAYLRKNGVNLKYLPRGRAAQQKSS